MGEWFTCLYPPFPYIRLEIKDSMGRKYLGYYALHGVWLTTEGHYPIKNPEYWRWVPKDSILDAEFRHKISERIIGTVCRVRRKSREMP